ncbi:DUF1028 domain-containing protein [soil metagenome]
MTFSIIGRLGDKFGMAVSSSSPAVAARCIHLRSGVGAAASQNITDPALGAELLDRLTSTNDSFRALDAVVGSARDITYRQLSLLGRTGPGAWYSGELALGIHGGACGTDSVAAGNMLANPGVPQAMTDAFDAHCGELEERLMAALHAAMAVGGEEGPVHSAGLAVVGDVPWRVTDLRVDWHTDPIQELGQLLDMWLPQRDTYLMRALDPSAAPSYGVPGDR